jgi:hypothetical protein
LERLVHLDVACELESSLPTNARFSICDLTGNCVYLYPDGSPAPPTGVTLSALGMADQQIPVAAILLTGMLLTMAAVFVAVRRRQPFG